MAGRIPKPTALKEEQGNPGHRALNKNEPKPETGIPSMPKWLSKAARKEWKEVIPILLKMKVLTRADGNAVGTYCQACATLAEAQRKIELHGITITLYETGKDGKILKDDAGELRLIPISVKTNPAVTIADKTMKLVRALGSDLGLTPASRARLKTEGEQKPEDPMAAFLNRRKSTSEVTQ
jgi:P27 family predicted phage terminase small subunit